MTEPLSYTDRATFLALMRDVDNEDEIQAATFAVALELTAGSPAPWADTDPRATEHWLLVHGANPQWAAAEAAKFELMMRTCVGISLGRPVETFAEIATWLAELEEDGDGQ